MTLNIQDLDNAKEDVDTIGSVANGGAGTVLSRLGETIKTLQLAIQSIGFSDIVTWKASTSYTDFQVLVVYSGQTYRLVEAHTSTGSFDPSKWLIFSGHAVTTDPTDTTPNALTKVGDFGLGNTGALPNYADITVDTPTKFTAINSTGPNVGELPDSENFLNAVVISRGLGGQRTILGFRDPVDNTPPEAWFRSLSDTNDSGWAKLYHSGNTNFNEFGGVAAFDVICTGVAISATQIKFYLPLSSVTSPSSVTVTSTFSLRRISGDTAGPTGIAALTVNSTTTSKMMVLQVNGLTGLAQGEPYELRTETGTSKIKVNF